MDLLIEQRYVLEAISKGAKTLDKILESTGLDNSMINNIIPELLINNLIQYKNKEYSIDLSNTSLWKNEVNKKENIKQEIRDLLCSSVDLMHKEKALHLRKVYLSELEEKLLNIELARVEKLINDIYENKKEVDNVKNMKVVYWGYSNYRDMISLKGA
ncbi:hypothetical protein BMS_0308 [Halobacteriovorax marinus SJ]|uniref:DUF4423 domain-containing protein n=1 Tax=Halobacteriovorax marinus (strain ATCC BAA-682 / DSM 15412 / SJ) TaxID=862908 RepID=E1X3D8_HALMS|nr:hypothetical protein [Halobacteriovorax marinus]CBW25233.1 hypothetical protein BMS_0308 [Halobacteriovorax marinus SJ]